MWESLIGTTLGGVLRLAPEVLGFFDRKNERKHELSVMAASLEADKSKAASAKDLAVTEGQYAYDLKAAEALIEATKSANVRTGIAWVDALTSSVRPVVTYLLVLGYLGFKIQAVGAGAEFWGTEDTTLLGTVIGFWFVNRTLEKWRR